MVPGQPPISFRRESKGDFDYETKHDLSPEADTYKEVRGANGHDTKMRGIGASPARLQGQKIPTEVRRKFSELTRTLI
jgi:hypothetical protein